MLKIDTRDEGGICVVSLHGQIDGGPASAEIQKSVKERLEAGKRKLLVNLAEVKWVNSLGVGNMIAAFASAKRENAVLKFCSASERVAAVLRTTGVIPEVFELHPDEAAGLRSFD